MTRGQQLRQTLYLRLQGQRVLRRAPDRLSFFAGLDQLVSIGFEQSLQGTNLAARDDLRLAPLIGAGFGGLRARHLPLIPQTPLVRVCCQLGRGQRPGHVGLLDPRQLTANILHMHHHAQNDSAIPALLPDPHSSFFIATRQQ